MQLIQTPQTDASVHVNQSKQKYSHTTFTTRKYLVLLVVIRVVVVFIIISIKSTTDSQGAGQLTANKL